MESFRSARGGSDADTGLVSRFRREKRRFIQGVLEKIGKVSTLFFIFEGWVFPQFTRDLKKINENLYFVILYLMIFSVRTCE